MCGVAGIASLSGAPVEPVRLWRMCETLAHRGPDDAGYALFRTMPGRGAYASAFTDPKFKHLNENLPVFGGAYFEAEVQRERYSVGLGHRRLSILDLSAYGHQPMSTADGRYWITYNGELYNYRELRAELVKDGVVFRTTSDTEVLLALWQARGREALASLDGMFAFAVFDTQRNELVLARDRFGVKPLYYARGPEHFVFASELKAILRSGLVDARFDPAHVVDYMTFQNLLGSATLFSGVRILGPGELVVVTPGAAGGEPAAEQWHHERPRALRDVSAEEVGDTFARAVKRQLVSDVEVGSYLSGGMDSGSIVAVAARHVPRLLTFTAGFDLTNVDGIEQGFDERAAADKLAHLLQTEHYHVVLHAGDMPAAMEKLTWHVDDPRVGMCHPNWYAAKLASRFVKVCLSGAGGDELFGGYPWRYRAAFQSADVDAFDDALFSFWHRLLPPSELPSLFGPELRALVPATRARFDDLLARRAPADDTLPLGERLFQRTLDFERRTFLHGFLVIEDHVSMAHGLETRVPFLDNALAALAAETAPRRKVDVDALANARASRIESADGKLILRAAMASFLPTEFTQQKKQGFSPPDENWYRGPSMDFIKQVLFDPRARTRPWFDQAVVGAKLEEHFQGQRNHRLLIWSLLSLEFLQRHLVDAPASGERPA